MDAYQIAQLRTHGRISELVQKIATQKMFVECLGMTNCAGKTAEESLAQHAEYEIALARLASLRQQLAELVHERDTFGVCL
jgi:hypothetical protein